jgi:hypothetical protein
MNVASDASAANGSTAATTVTQSSVSAVAAAACRRLRPWAPGSRRVLRAAERTLSAPGPCSGGVQERVFVGRGSLGKAFGDMPGLARGFGRVVGLARALVVAGSVGEAERPFGRARGPSGLVTADGCRTRLAAGMAAAGRTVVPVDRSW